MGTVSAEPPLPLPLPLPGLLSLIPALEWKVMEEERLLFVCLLSFPSSSTSEAVQV